MRDTGEYYRFCLRHLERTIGFRFRRTLKIVPGVDLNLSASGVSVSLGPRGLRHTIGSRDTRTTVGGLPGSGPSWSANQPYSSTDRSPPPDQPVRYVSDADTSSGGSKRHRNRQRTNSAIGRKFHNRYCRRIDRQQIEVALI